MALSALLVLPAVCLGVGRFAVGQTVLRLPSHFCPRVTWLALYPSPTCRMRGACGQRPAWFRTVGGGFAVRTPGLRRLPVPSVLWQRDCCGLLPRRPSVVSLPVDFWAGIFLISITGASPGGKPESNGLEHWSAVER